MDEVITLGYKENGVTLETIRTNLEMDSHNEKLHQMVQQSKMNEARDEAKRKAASIKASNLTKRFVPGSKTTTLFRKRMKETGQPLNQDQHVCHIVSEAKAAPIIATTIL